MKPTIIIADDHPVTAKGMETILIQKGFDVIGTYENGILALNMIVLSKPNFVLLDVQMPGMTGIEIARKINEKQIRSKIIMYTMFADVSLFQEAKKLGVQGFLLKEFAIEDIEICLTTLLQGNSWYHPNLESRLRKTTLSFDAKLYKQLTSKEKSILSCVADGKSTKTIALEHFVSEKTVESHRRNIILKLNIPKQKNTLLRWALENRAFFSLMK